MYLTPGVVLLAILLVGAIAWCVYIVRRLPSDLAELREQYAMYRASKTQEALSKFETLKERQDFQRERAVEFWSTFAAHACFFWPVTIAVLFLFLVPVTWTIVARIVGALRSF